MLATREQALLSAVCAEPEDDGLRLVYADWLEEQGRSDRAEFIRVQVELSRTPPGEERRPALEARELQLLAAHRKEWSRPLRPWVKACEFRRGFVEGVKLAAHTFLERAEELFRLAPVRHVHLIDISIIALADELAACPHLARIRSLAL